MPKFENTPDIKTIISSVSYSLSGSNITPFFRDYDEDRLNAHLRTILISQKWHEIVIQLHVLNPKVSLELHTEILGQKLCMSWSSVLAIFALRFYAEIILVHLPPDFSPFISGLLHNSCVSDAAQERHFQYT